MLHFEGDGSIITCNFKQAQGFGGHWERALGPPVAFVAVILDEPFDVLEPAVAAVEDAVAWASSPVAIQTPYAGSYKSSGVLEITPL